MNSFRSGSRPFPATSWLSMSSCFEGVGINGDARQKTSANMLSCEVSKQEVPEQLSLLNPFQSQYDCVHCEPGTFELRDDGGKT